MSNKRRFTPEYKEEIKRISKESYDYQNLLRENGCIQSMSAKGYCYDNAPAESFFPI